MAVQELELENLITKDKQTVIEKFEKAKLSSELANKSLCYMIKKDTPYYENEYQIVLATTEVDKPECNTIFLVIPPDTGEITSTPKGQLIKLGPDTELVKNTYFRQKLIEVVFQQESFDAIELLLRQNVFSWEGFLRISVRFPSVLKYAIEMKLPDYRFPFDAFTDGNTILHDCVVYDSGESLKLILDTLHDETFQSRNGVTKEILQEFIDRRDRLGLSPLFLSVTKQSQACLVELLKAGADVDFVDINGNSVFHIAGYFSNHVAINTIFSDVESTNGDIKLRNAMKLLNRLHLPPIVMSKSEEITSLYLKYIDLNESFDERGNFIIHMAAKFNNLPLVKSLLSRGVDLDCTNKDNLTPLKISADEGYLGIVEVLVEAGASVRDERGVNTALFMAGFRGHSQVVKLLIEHGAPVQNKERSLLHVAAYGGNSELIDYLVGEQKLDVNALDSEGESPLFKAIHAGCKVCVRTLLTNGAYPNQVNGNNENLLTIAIENGLVDVVKLLVQYKVDRSYLKPNGMSSLMLACVNDDVDILTILAQDITPKSIRHKDNEGNNLLHVIAKYDSINCLNFILKESNLAIDVDELKEIVYTEKNNEGLILCDIVFQLRSEHLKDYLSFGYEHYFLDNPQVLHNLYDEGLYDILVIILDKMVKTDTNVTVNLKYFDSTSDGLYPGDKGFRFFRKTLFHKILDCPNEELKYHPVVSLIAKTKLAPYSFVSYVQLFAHFWSILIVAFALISGSYVCLDQLHVYNDPLSYGRLATEIFSILFFALQGFMQILHFGSEWRQIYDNDLLKGPQYIMEIFWMRESKKFSVFRKQGFGIQSDFIKRAYALDSKTRFFFTALYSYFSKLYHVLDLSILMSVILFIILRIIGDQIQWAFASLTFMLLTISFLQYIRIIPSLGAYIGSVLAIFAEDIPKFVTVTSVILVGYIGSIHLAGRFEALLMQANDSVCSNTSFIYWFNPADTVGYDLRYPITSGLILMLDGGPGNREGDLINLNIIFYGVYLFFAFLVIVVLLNILIAQMSQTYAEISSEREFHFSIYLAVFFELHSTTNVLFGKYYRPRGVIDRITMSKSKWQEYLDKSPNRNSDLLVRDIDNRSKRTSGKIELINDITKSFMKKFSSVSDLLVRIYSGVIDGRSDFSRESKRLKSAVEGDATLESVSTRLDGLEEKMERIVHLLETKK